MRGECLRRAVEGLGKSAELKRGTYPNASGGAAGRSAGAGVA